MTTSLLFTAFEPSGDTLASRVIERLRSVCPELEIHAWGGPQMAQAGARLHANTVDKAAMGLGALAHVQRIRKLHRDILQWAQSHEPACLVPVDSPAANFPLCKALKPRGVKVVHLAAPQLWAWAPWRSRKLRRCTDQVLCLLPFEPDWFSSRNIPARFVGHPAINRELDESASDPSKHNFPDGARRLLLMPGSREQEIIRNVPLMMQVKEMLEARISGLSTVMTAVDEEKASIVRGVLPASSDVMVAVGQRDAALDWCHMALAVSGTVTLDIMRHVRPMVGMFRTGPVGWLGGKIILTTSDRLLPNLIAGRRIVPEFVPHWGGAAPIASAVGQLLDSEDACQQQRDAIQAAMEPYKGQDFAGNAAAAIMDVLKA
ncbi:MAG: hypothetical protein P8M22_06515 [Phycisphaerales bacterium]|nr:hypothetical protein [Phycisphaerales bacterium]